MENYDNLDLQVVSNGLRAVRLNHWGGPLRPPSPRPVWVCVCVWGCGGVCVVCGCLCRVVWWCVCVLVCACVMNETVPGPGLRVALDHDVDKEHVNTGFRSPWTT